MSGMGRQHLNPLQMVLGEGGFMAIAIVAVENV